MLKKLLSKILIISLVATLFFSLTAVGGFALSVGNATGQINNKGTLSVRKSTSTSSKKVATVKNNTKVTISNDIFKSKTSDSKSKRWYKITVNGKTGYVLAKRVDNLKYASLQGTVCKAGTIYRAGAGTKMKKKGTLKKGTQVTVLMKAQPVSSTKGSSSTWYRIRYKNNVYFVCSANISLIANSPSEVSSGNASKPAPTIKVTSLEYALPAYGQINSTSGVNVRSESNTSSSIVTVLSNNKTVCINKVIFKSKTSTAAEDKWYKISADGKTGYIRADLVDNITYNKVSGTVTGTCKYRVGAGTSMTSKGSLSKGKKVDILLEAQPVSSTKGSSDLWYMISINGNKYYVCSSNINITSIGTPQAPMDDKTFQADLKSKGFPDTYITKLMEVHKIHPNWSFTAKNCGSWSTAVAAEAKGKFSLIQRSGSSKWVSANETEIKYYMDPRNFFNDERIFQFENLNFNPTLHTEAVVNKVLSGTQLAANGFQASWFVKYGAQYNTSPVHLASRARQETGGGSIAINGKGTYNNTVVYNPFNIGAYSTVSDGLKKAYEMGWTTKEKSIAGGAQFIGNGYINAGQNTMYSQKFNIVNGAATHQYMQNIKAPYAESYSTYASYAAFGILYDGHSFQIPVYSGMPSSTKL